MAGEIARRQPADLIQLASNPDGPVSLDVNVAYRPGGGWTARLITDSPTASAFFGKGATPGLAVASLIELAAHTMRGRR